jgi:hypothetical protein
MDDCTFVVYEVNGKIIFHERSGFVPAASSTVRIGGAAYCVFFVTSVLVPAEGSTLAGDVKAILEKAYPDAGAISVAFIDDRPRGMITWSVKRVVVVTLRDAANSEPFGLSHPGGRC